MALRILPKRCEQLVSQEELAQWFGFENHIAHLRGMQAKIELSILDRLMNGAEVEVGSHSATLETEIRGRRHVSRVVIR